MSQNIWSELEWKGLEYLVVVGVKWAGVERAGIFYWSWSEMGMNIWMELDVQWAEIFGWSWSQMGKNI